MIRQFHETKWLLLAAAFYYAVVLPRFYVGYLSDDARDILASRSLLSGHYSNWQFPGHPPTNFPLPGFPLVLAPFTFFFFHHPALLRVVPYFFSLACIPLANALFTPWLRPRMRCCLLMLFAFNPTTVASSGRVMADACFMAATLAAFVLFQSAARQPQQRGMGWAGALVGLAALVRPEGILLLPAMAIPLFYSRGRRSIGPLFLFGALPLLCVWIRNYGVSGHISGYTSIWRDSLPLLSGQYQPFLKNMAMEFATLGAGLIGGWDFNLIAVPDWVWVYSGFLMVLLLKGFQAIARAREKETAVIAAFLIYAVGFFLLHALWLVVDLHYLWPLLPIALFFGIKGFASSARRWARGIGGMLLLCLLGSYAYQYADAVRETRHLPLLSRFPQETLRWIAQTPPESFFLAPNAPLVSLYTHRFATAYLEAHNADEFRYRLMQTGITHVLLRPPHFLYVRTVAGRNPNEVWAQVPSWIASEPSRFSRVYENPSEEASVYAVRADPDFMAAFSLYLKAREAIDRDQPDVGMALLNASFRHARLPGALNAYAMTCLLSGNHLREAQTALEEALRRRPQFPLAALNLARVAARLHDRARARYYFEAARTMSAADPEARFFIPMIDREEKEM